MSWFDTTKLASMANKAMKEAQKTLDSALEINEEGGENPDASAALWNTWKKLKSSDSSSSISEQQQQEPPSDPTSPSWGSFTGSFIDAASVGLSNTGQPVSMQPKRSKLETVVTSESSAVLGGDSQVSLQTLQPIPSSLQQPPPSPSDVETISEREESPKMIVEDSVSMSPEMKSVSLGSSRMSHSSISVVKSDDSKSVSPEMKSVSLESSISVISPSSVEVIHSPPSDMELVDVDTVDAPRTHEHDVDSPKILADIVDTSRSALNSINSQELDTSGSSDRTLVVGDLLTDALMERAKSESSTSSSEIVKVESLPVSEVTSCDELEGCNYSTSNSSDIEVLHSPDQQRNRKSDLTKMGHSRNISDQSIKEEPEDTEKEQLKTKNRELTELLAARESKLVAVSREIVHLQEESGDMSIRLQTALEQAKAEKIVSDELKNKINTLEDARKNATSSKANLEKEISKLTKALKEAGSEDGEKDEIIADLRNEGEALAKQNGKQAETIRKLRAKEKTFDTDLEKYKSEADKNSSEVDRLSKSLAAKNELEVTQVEAIKNLTEANQAWEAENRKLKNDLEDNVEKVTGLRSSLEAAYREMAEMKRKLEEAAGEAQAAALSKEIASKEKAVGILEEERMNWNFDKQTLENQIRGLQDNVKLQEQAAEQREELYRQEVSNLRQRLEQSDTRHEDLAESIGQATKPLLRQIETLQSSLRESTVAQESVEQSLNLRLEQVSTSLAGAQERERAAAEQYRGASRKVATLEGALETEKRLRSTAEDKVTEIEELNNRLKILKEKEEESFKSLKKSLGDEINELKKEKEFLAANLEAEKCESESLRRKSVMLMEQLKERDRRVRELQAEVEAVDRGRSSRASIHSSPTPSLSQLSVAGSESNPYQDISWPEEVFTGNPGGSSVPSLYSSVGRLGGSGAVVESLSSQLKLKEGEILQLQAELQGLDKVREDMVAELTRLTIKSDQIDRLSEEFENLKSEYGTLQQKYQTMLTMYGEKTEEAEELRLDLEDVKEMYKMQIDQLTGQK